MIIWGLITRTVIATFLQPGFDEAYYYNYTLYPNISYFDHPPLVGLVTGFGIWLTGEVSQLTIRLGSLFLYTGTLIFLYLTSVKLFAVKVATLTLAIVTTIPFFQVGFGILILPDSPLMFFWSACLCLAAHEFFDDLYKPSYRLAGIGLLVGLACLGKYHGLILGLGLLGFCLVNPPHRLVWRSPWTLIGFGLFLVTISPVLIWNYQHEWVSFLFQGTRAIPASGYKLEGLLVTLLIGAGYLFPTFGLPIWWVSFGAVGEILRSLTSQKSVKPWINRLIKPELDLIQQKQLLILAVSLPVFLGFTLMGGYRQILPSWHMPGFFGATLLLGRAAAIAQERDPKLIRNWLWGSGVTILVILSLALAHVTNGLVQKDGNQAILGGFWAAKDDPSTQLIDIQQLRQGFIDSPLLMSELAKSSFVFSNNFFVAGQLGMAIAPLTQKLQHQPITCFDQDIRGFAFWESAIAWLGKDGLYITSELFQEPLSKYDGYFESITKIADIPIIRGGEAVQIFHVYRSTKLLRTYPRPYGLV